ncbi:MAG: hypothetical protein LBR80_05840 [Deltaproteobacteria bacterium]|jgi:transposase|nr:hypothetical protein [Deltaproteobacteria bacterium]
MWDSSHKLHAHIFNDQLTEAIARANLFGNLADKSDKILSGEIILEQDDPFSKFLRVVKSKSKKSGLIVRYNNGIIRKSLSTSGWMVVLSNFVKSAPEAIKIFRDKDVIERSFYVLKNSLDTDLYMCRKNMFIQNKAFIIFISLILTSHIHRVMIDNNLYKKFTMKELIKTMESHKIIYIKSDKILLPATAEQKMIYSAFGLKTPE